MKQFADTINKRHFVPNPLEQKLIQLGKYTAPYGMVEYPEGHPNITHFNVDEYETVWHGEGELPTVERKDEAIIEKLYSDMGAEEYVSLRTINPRKFSERFTEQEIISVYTKANEVVQVKIWLDQLFSGYVYLEHETLLAGMAWFVYEGLLTQERHDILLGDIVSDEL